VWAARRAEKSRTNCRLSAKARQLRTLVTSAAAADNFLCHVDTPEQVEEDLRPLSEFGESPFSPSSAQFPTR